MDEQRQNAYINLLRQMVTHSSSERELEILLSANQDLIDSGLVKTVDQLVAMHLAQGNQEFANLLRALANQLTMRLNPPLGADLDAYCDCVLEVLNTMRKSGGDAKVMYPLLQANLEKLNNSFAAGLHILGRQNFHKLPPENAQSLAATIHDFGKLMQEFPLGDRANNIEIAIACCEVAPTVYTREAHPQLWGIIQNSLGVAYLDRIKGDRALNLEQAIRCHEAAWQVLTRKVFPTEWAMTQVNLGNAYQERIKGECATNLEMAIQYYQAAFQVYDKENFPDIWGTIQNNLGGVYLKRIRGNRGENIESAIACFLVALSVRTRSANPQEWAMSQNNLGNAYLYRIEGNRALNLEQAIWHYEAALQVCTHEAFPRDWADTTINLGKVYQERIYGEKAENLERAIAYYQTGLSVHTCSASPEKWAGIQHELGTIYCGRIQGERTDNFELALAALQSALSVYTYDTFPEKWATLQIDLGRAYFHQVSNNRAEEIEMAISCYQAALPTLTREDFSYKWAAIQLNLGAAYINRKLGDKSQNLEDAIIASQAALQVYTRESFPLDWALIQNNLGSTYCDRIRGKRTENLELALCYYQAGLSVHTRKAFPELWGKLQMNMGNAYRKLGQTEAAITCFRCALEIFTPTSFPLNCLMSGYHLGETAFTAGLWAEAIEGYGIAIEAVETNRAWMSTDARRQEIVQQAFNFNMNLVQACINNRQLDKAVEYVERSRSRRLVDLVASNDFEQGGEISSEVQEYLHQYESLQQQINQERFRKNQSSDRELIEVGNKTSISEAFPENRAALQAYNETIKSLEAEKQQVWEQLRRLDPVLAGQVQVSSPNFAAIQQLIDQRTTAILSFYTTYTDTYVFVVRQNQISCHTCSSHGLETLHDRGIFDNWLKPYLAACDPTKTKQERPQLKAAWMNQISPFLAELSRRLQLDELIATHLGGIEELILIPCLNLHLIPFAALPLENRSYLGDKFLIRYAPSCQVLEFCQKRPQVGNELVYGTVEDATEDLPFSSFEGEEIAKLHGISDDRRLRGQRQATVYNYQQLVKQVQVILSSHHASSRLDKPLESILVLGDGAISLGQLLTPVWRLCKLVDVFLSCCETGLGIAQITDDILTLSTGFLCAGARNVVSTLWLVDDLATALLSIFYHRYRKQGSCRPAALQQAQEELRSLSGQTLATVYHPQLTLLLDQKFQQAEKARKEAKANRDKETKEAQAYLKWDEEYKRHTKAAERIRKIKNRLNALCQESFPFSHPFYWAAFTCSGLR